MAKFRSLYLNPPPLVPFDYSLREGGVVTEQAHAEFCDVNNLVAHHIDVISAPVYVQRKSQALYADCSTPKTYESFVEAKDSLSNLVSEFNKFPEEIRNEFDNDFSKFLNSYGDGSLSSKLEKYSSAPNNDKLNDDNGAIDTSKPTSEGDTT